MNLQHRLLQLGKAASDKIDQALPGFGLVGVLYLAADIELAVKGLGSPTHQQFWQQYGHQLANGDLFRAAGTIFIAAAMSSTTLGIIGKRIPQAKEYAQVALGTLAVAGCGVFLAAAVKNHDLATAGTATILGAANTLLLSGTKAFGKVVDPAINFVKRRVRNFNTENLMSAGLVTGSLPMFVDAARHHDIGLAAVATLWSVAAYKARREMKNKPTPSL